MDGNIDNVCHKTEGGERRMQEEGVETPFVSVVCNEKYGIQCNRIIINVIIPRKDGGTSCGDMSTTKGWSK